MVLFRNNRVQNRIPYKTIFLKVGTWDKYLLKQILIWLFSPQVYTVNLESRYLLIQGVPALGVMKELVEQFALYGTIEEYNPLDDYPAEEFTEVYLIKFQKIQNARYE